MIKLKCVVVGVVWRVANAGEKKLTYVRYSLSSQTKVNVASPMRCYKLQRIVMYPSVHSTQVESEE